MIAQTLSVAVRSNGNMSPKALVDEPQTFNLTKRDRYPTDSLKQSC